MSYIGSSAADPGPIKLVEAFPIYKLGQSTLPMTFFMNTFCGWQTLRWSRGHRKAHAYGLKCITVGSPHTCTHPWATIWLDGPLVWCSMAGFETSALKSSCACAEKELGCVGAREGCTWSVNCVLWPNTTTPSQILCASLTCSLKPQRWCAAGDSKVEEANWGWHCFFPVTY